ncbi:MAG: hypothetical protein HC915_07780 [Anaerolineae bacterium]|nr:hypothetical protein [Anaerolineae bacterium]
MDGLRVAGEHVLDGLGRQVLLRGVNLAGSSKLPSSHPVQREDDFSQHRQVSFVGALSAGAGR